MSAHHERPTFHVFKILPASDCAPGITSENPAKPMIPRDQGGAVPGQRTREFYFETALSTPPSKWFAEIIFGGNPRTWPAMRSNGMRRMEKGNIVARKIPTSRKGRETWGTQCAGCKQSRGGFWRAAPFLRWGVGQLVVKLFLADEAAATR
jgi:hypothetical protein